MGVGPCRRKAQPRGSEHDVARVSCLGTHDTGEHDDHEIRDLGVASVVTKLVPIVRFFLPRQFLAW